MSSKLEIKALQKSYSQGNTCLRVLEAIDFTVGQGEFVCLLGSSGSGKSTLLRMIAGFETPDSGEIVLDGQPVTGPTAKRIMVFQDFNQLFPWKTVLENVVFPLKMKRIGASDRERRAMAAVYLAMVKLEGCEQCYPHQLSGGMKQKAAIARALALQPELLLMDEPFGSLDAQTREVLQQTLVKVWQDTGVTIVFVTHDIQEAVILADRIVILSKNNHRIREIVQNTLNRPRDPGDPLFPKMWQEVYGMLDATE
ncbi:NitT/TauT family transport system ATP-binding protein [Hydrogenispora ethanolica]|uniref:NitT/TauT family transport system ATP-binding protein n=2 Tax=Hydrogenispora ethanolica TaxID=1082276 RepID=A0A4R1RSP1_HYDET|nr:NitT/TauT family transport system ATP-binding protein [Hydrogenispora ethanolica]